MLLNYDLFSAVCIPKLPERKSACITYQSRFLMRPAKVFHRNVWNMRNALERITPDSQLLVFYRKCDMEYYSL